MSHRLKILLGVLVVLIVLVFFSVQEENGRGTVFRKEVALADTGAVGKIIFLGHGKPETVIAQNRKGEWMLNGMYESRDYLRNLLLTGLNKLQVKREVSENQKEQVTRYLKTEGFLVKLFDQEGKQIRSFYIARNETDPNSAYYLQGDSRNPLIVFVPGFEGSIANLFELPVSDWRTKLFFVSSERNLQKIVLNYPSYPDAGFSISYGKGHYSVLGVPDPDSTVLAQYLNYYRYLTINQYVEDQDSLSKILENKPPLVKLYVESLSQKAVMDIYELKNNVYAWLPKQNEWVTLRPEVYNRLLVKKSYFKRND